MIWILEAKWFLDEAHSSDKTQALDLSFFGITKQALTKVRPHSEKSAQSNQLIRMFSAWYVAATPMNIVGSFRGSGIVVRWQEDRGCLLAEVVPEEADHVQELYLHEQEEDETDNEPLSDHELDDLVANPEEIEKIDRGATKPLHESPLSRECVESLIDLVASKSSSRSGAVTELRTFTQLPISVCT
jgi:hypothetical protein